MTTQEILNSNIKSVSTNVPQDISVSTDNVSNNNVPKVEIGHSHAQVSEDSSTRFDSDKLRFSPNEITKYLKSERNFATNENGDGISLNYGRIDSDSFKRDYLKRDNMRTSFQKVMALRQDLERKFPDYTFLPKGDKLVAMGPDFRCFDASELLSSEDAEDSQAQLA